MDLAVARVKATMEKAAKAKVIKAKKHKGRFVVVGGGLSLHPLSHLGPFPFHSGEDLGVGVAAVVYGGLQLDCHD